MVCDYFDCFLSVKFLNGPITLIDQPYICKYYTKHLSLHRGIRMVTEVRFSDISPELCADGSHRRIRSLPLPRLKPRQMLPFAAYHTNQIAPAGDEMCRDANSKRTSA